MPKKHCSLNLIYGQDELKKFTGKIYTSDGINTIYENGVIVSAPHIDEPCCICVANNLYELLKNKCPVFKKYIKEYGGLEPDIDTWLMNDDDGNVLYVARWLDVEMRGKF